MLFPQGHLDLLINSEILMSRILIFWKVLLWWARSDQYVTIKWPWNNINSKNNTSENIPSRELYQLSQSSMLISSLFYSTIFRIMDEKSTLYLILSNILMKSVKNYPIWNIYFVQYIQWKCPTAFLDYWSIWFFIRNFLSMKEKWGYRK